METPVEFSAGSYAKMILHTMKYPHSVCSGLLLSSKQIHDDDDDEGDTRDRSQSPIKIVDAIPVLHTSHYLAPTMELALNAVSEYAKSKDLCISGYYQADKLDSSPSLGPDVFGQRVAEKICESHAGALLCVVNYEAISNEDQVKPHFSIDQYQLADGKWRRRSTQAIKVAGIEVEVVTREIILSKKQAYSRIVDFDDHLNDISLDWTNSFIGGLVKELAAAG